MPDQERKLRVGVLGCGQIAQAAHFESCRRAHNAELYAICDLAPDLLQRMTEIHQPKVAYTSFETMLADPQVDAVVIAAADQFHVPLSLQALAAGKPVLVEKPMGVTVEECQMLVDTVNESRLILQVGNMKRYDPGITFARDFIESELGELLSMRAYYMDSTFRYLMTDNTQPIIETSSLALRPAGNPKANQERYYLLRHGSHLVDTAAYLCGPLAAVRARHLERYGAHTWSIEVQFSSGQIGHLDLTVAIRSDWHEGFEVHGEHGSLFGKTKNPWFLEASEVECIGRDGVIQCPLAADGHFFRRQIEGFADAVLGNGRQTGATASDGLAALRALAAISESVRTDEWVALDSATGSP